MGSIYRQKGKGSNWIIKYYRDGRPIVESTGTDDKKKAGKILRGREADIDRGLPLSSGVGRIRFDEAARDVETDYALNSRRSVGDLKRRIKNHLTPVFGGRRLATLVTADVRTFAKQQLDAGYAPAEINRQLAVLKRMFSLAVKGGKLLFRPHIPMLTENNVRTGFFEREQFESVRAHLPEAYRGAVTFAYLTGWRIQSEVLALEWRQVDDYGGCVRLDSGATKNREGRLFPFDVLPELHQVLVAQRAMTDAVEKRGKICPWVFHEAGEPLLVKGGWATKEFRRAWTAATKSAGCPGRIPHDFRRTAVRNLVRAGVPEKTAMLLTGHKTRSVFDRYDIVNEADLREAVTRLGDLPAKTAASRRGRVVRLNP